MKLIYICNHLRTPKSWQTIKKFEILYQTKILILLNVFSSITRENNTIFIYKICQGEDKGVLSHTTRINIISAPLALICCTRGELHLHEKHLKCGKWQRRREGHGKGMRDTYNMTLFLKYESCIKVTTLICCKQKNTGKKDW